MKTGKIHREKFQEINLSAQDSPRGGRADPEKDAGAMETVQRADITGIERRFERGGFSFSDKPEFARGFPPFAGTDELFFFFLSLILIWK